jgi:hypothetical protein
MFLTKTKIAGTLLAAIVAVGVTMAVDPLSPQADKPGQSRWEVATGKEPEQPAKDKEPKVDDPTGSKASASKQNELVLKQHLEEYKAALKSAQGQGRMLKKVIKQEREEIVGKLTKIDVEKNTVSITLRDTDIAINALPLSSAVKILVKTKGETLDALKVGMQVKMKIETTDGKSLVSVVREVLETDVDILAEGSGPIEFGEK